MEPDVTGDEDLEEKVNADDVGVNEAYSAQLQVDIEEAKEEDQGC